MIGDFDDLVRYAERVAGRFSNRFYERWADDWETHRFYDLHLQTSHTEWEQAEEEWLTRVRDTCLKRLWWRRTVSELRLVDVEDA